MLEKLKSLFRKEKEEKNENIKRMKELYKQNNELLLQLLEKSEEE